MRRRICKNKREKEKEMRANSHKIGGNLACWKLEFDRVVFEHDQAVMLINK